MVGWLVSSEHAIASRWASEQRLRGGAHRRNSGCLGAVSRPLEFDSSCEPSSSSWSAVSVRPRWWQTVVPGRTWQFRLDIDQTAELTGARQDAAADGELFRCALRIARVAAEFLWRRGRRLHV